MYVIILNMFVCFVQQALCCFCGSMMCILPDFEHHALFGEYVCLNVASNITCAASKIQRSYIIFDIINTKWPWFIYYHAYQNSKHHPGEIAKPLPRQHAPTSAPAQIWTSLHHNENKLTVVAKITDTRKKGYGTTRTLYISPHLKSSPWRNTFCEHSG